MPEQRNFVVTVTRYRPTALLWLSAVLTLSIVLPLPGGRPEAQAPPAQGQGPGQNRQSRQNRPPSEVGWEWWRDAAVVKELTLSPEKVKQIDGYYNSRQRALKPYVDEWLRERDVLNRMTEERVVDFNTYSLQVKKVEMLRSELFLSRTVMLYRIYLVLQPQQYQKLLEIFDRRSRRSVRGGGGEVR
jgi:Spy/CpxP family protein refolding chaperone